MPGYRPLHDGNTEEHIGIAGQCDELARTGREPEAAQILEALIVRLEEAECAPPFSPVPIWPYGRLAFLYRKLRRHRDEVAILERYIARQPPHAEMVRFEARLCKARALLDRGERQRIMPLRSDRATTVRRWSVQPER